MTRLMYKWLIWHAASGYKEASPRQNDGRKFEKKPPNVLKM